MCEVVTVLAVAACGSYIDDLVTLFGAYTWGVVAYPIPAAVATLLRVPTWEDDASGDGRSDCVTPREDGKE